MKTKKLSFLLVLVLLFLINDKVIPQVVHSQHRTPIARIQQRNYIKSVVYLLMKLIIY